MHVLAVYNFNNIGSRDVLKYLSGIVKKCAVIEYPKSWIGRYQAA